MMGRWGARVLDRNHDGSTASRQHYLELTVLLINREVAKFRRGEQAALVSFSHVAKLARAATDELRAPGALECVDRCEAGRRADVQRRSA
jgi:hypothetical protein